MDENENEDIEKEGEPRNLVEGGRVDETQKILGAEQEVQHVEQMAQAIRQTKQGLRQDQQGVRQDKGQEQQNITDQITTAHTEQIIEVQERQLLSDQNLDQIIEGVDLLGIQVTTLNERVYTKNYLDRIRNWLIVGFMVSFLITSAFLAFLLIGQNQSDEKRANDAVLGRRQLADCTVAPGVILEGGYINPGLCYINAQERSAALIKELSTNIINGVGEILEENK